MKTTYCMTIVSSKGGVGKTTTAGNLSGILADMGQKVLMIDCDRQPTLSSFYPLLTRPKYGLLQAIQQASITPDHVAQTQISNLDVVVSNDHQNRLYDLILRDFYDGRERLKRAVDGLEGYDFIVIDTQGADGPIQDIGVLAADLLLSPIYPEALTAREFLRGTMNILNRLGDDPNSHR